MSKPHALLIAPTTPAGSLNRENIASHQVKLGFAGNWSIFSFTI
jgi:hypothetical protein